ncbi:NADPH-dependent F420 reductase [Mesorhizobium yinganensis]|uniref:NADPH-dependent F420 reductase n=1 Tax=Mesorhizobium yinganensis TaxID=3157707 RepID=UPI0032B84232
MRIGIIGAGNIGQALAKLAVGAGHEVMLSNSRGPESLAETAAEIGCAAGTAAQAAEFGEIVVVTVPLKNVTQIDPAPLAGKTVIDTNNYYPNRDGRIADLDELRTTTSSMVAAHFSRSHVVKAFNAILAADLPKSAGSLGLPGRRALPIAGDDAASKAAVADLHAQFGFDVVDAGRLEESWRFERAKPAYCIPLVRDDLRAALAKAERDVELPHGSWWR